MTPRCLRSQQQGKGGGKVSLSPEHGVVSVVRLPDPGKCRLPDIEKCRGAGAFLLGEQSWGRWGLGRQEERKHPFSESLVDEEKSARG